MTVAQTCDWYSCNRPVEKVDGWGFAACKGHFIIGQANADSWGARDVPGAVDELRAEYRRAKIWLDAHPNPS